MALQDNVVVGRHYPAIDGLRAIAILLVLWWHASDFSADANGYELGNLWFYHGISAFGSYGVVLFFFISGFLITGILLDTADQKSCLKNFYIRRSLRIFPLYYAGLIFMTLVSVYYIKDFHINQHLIYNALYIQNWAMFFDETASPFNGSGHEYFGHTWSLAVEEQFYLIWPFFFLFLLKRCNEFEMIVGMTSLIMISLLTRFYIADEVSWQLLSAWTVTRMDALIAGGVLAYLYKIKPDLYKKLYPSALPFFILFFAGIIFFLTYFSGREEFHHLAATYGLSATLLLFSALIVMVMGGGKDGFIAGILSASILRKTAKISYGLYIFHQPIFRALAWHIKDLSIGYLEGHLIILTIGSTLTFAIAWLSYNYFEKPILNLKDKFAGYEGNS